MGARLLLLPQRFWGPMHTVWGLGPWGGPTSPGCFWLLVAVRGEADPAGTPHLSPSLRDAGMAAHQETMLRRQHGGAEVPGGHRQPHGDTTAPLAVSPAGGCEPGSPESAAATSSSTQPPSRRGRRAQAGTLRVPPPWAPRAGGAGMAGEGGGRPQHPRGRLDFEGSSEPADSGSVILRGM